MHAWASVWCGEDAGWIGFDPTNGMLAGTDHVVLAIGRDYADVAPMDGVIFASGAQRLETSVRVRAGRLNLERWRCRRDRLLLRRQRRRRYLCQRSFGLSGPRSSFAAAAAYHGSFWKLSLRLGRLASRGVRFRSFLLFFIAIWHQCLPHATQRLGRKFAYKSAAGKLFSQHRGEYASRNIGLRRSLRCLGALIVLLLSRIMRAIEANFLTHF